MIIKTSKLLEIISKTVENYGDVPINIEYQDKYGDWKTEDDLNITIAIPIKGSPKLIISATPKEDWRFEKHSDGEKPKLKFTDEKPQDIYMWRYSRTV